MGAFQCRDDSFQAGQFESGFQCFVVIDSQDRGAVADGQIGVNRADSRIVQSGRDRVGLFDLSVLALHAQGTGSVYDSFPSQLDGGGAHT